MDVIKFFALVFVLFNLSCIGSQLPRDLQKKGVADIQTVKGEVVTGEIASSDGSALQLQNYSQQNLVVMFAQFFCEVCKKEAHDLAQSLGAGFQEPSNAKLITIVISSSPAKAAAWKETQKVPWTVASIPNNFLLKKYCPEGLTPCTVIQKPGKGVVFIQQGEVTPQEIKNHVGPWVFDQQLKQEINKETSRVQKISTGNAKLDAVLNDPNNICTPHGSTVRVNGSQR